MSKPTVKEWLEALKAGPKKGRHKLKNSAGGMCCLGVLANLNDPDAWTRIRIYNGGYIWNSCYYSINPVRYVSDPQNLPPITVDSYAKLNDLTAGFDAVIKVIETGKLPDNYDDLVS